MLELSYRSHFAHNRSRDLNRDYNQSAVKYPYIGDFVTRMLNPTLPTANDCGNQRDLFAADLFPTSYVLTNQSSAVLRDAKKKLTFSKFV